MNGRWKTDVPRTYAALNCPPLQTLGAVMNKMETVIKGTILLVLTISSSACIVAEPREGYYDREHTRYYHEHKWHECGERNDFCH